MTTPKHRKVALITGSGKQRVGNAIAHELAAHGYSVALHYHRSADDAQQTLLEIKEQGIPAEAFQADMAVEADVQRLFDQTLATFGRLDVLVTAAAVWNATPLEEVTADEVRKQFEVNTLGTFLCCQKAGLAMVAQPEGGAIVTIGDWAIEQPYLDYSAYFASKGALPTITRSLAVELARRNPAVRVNCILPGPVLPPEQSTPEEIQTISARTLLQRMGTPAEVAHAVMFLVENKFVTGVCLPVDGGRSILGGIDG